MGTDDARGWRWVARCRVLNGRPTLEMWDEAVAAGAAMIPVLVDVLGRRGWREGIPDDCANLPVVAIRLLGELREASSLPAILSVLSDPVDPALHGEEAALALARFGEEAFPSVSRILFDGERECWVRALAARALMYAALRDRRLRPRVRACFERVLRNAAEKDRVLSANVVDCACRMACAALAPAIAAAFDAGRVDEDFTRRNDALMDVIARHQVPDSDARASARHDPREDCLPWAEQRDQYDAEALASVENDWALIDAHPPGRPPDDEEDEEDE
jgi:hypothetical protein